MWRWAIEETIRFWKHSYDVENIRLLGYTSLQNMMPLILGVSYFAAIVLDIGSKLRVTAAYVLKPAKRVFGIPDFRYYAIADGLRSIFMRHPGKPYRLFWPKLPPQRGSTTAFLKNGPQQLLGPKSHKKIGGSPLRNNILTSILIMCMIGTQGDVF